MTKEAKKEQQQGDHSGVADEMVNRLGAPFADICLWAVERGLALPLDIGYHILGLDPHTVAIGNLVQELTHRESREITQQWRDSFVIHELSRFAEAFVESSAISGEYASISHRGGVEQNRRQFKNIERKTFLLTLITNPLVDTNASMYRARRRLRIWLLGQAANSLLEHGCAAERSISSVARFLILGDGDERWTIVDELLKTAGRQLSGKEALQGFEQFSMAVGQAALALKHEPAYRKPAYQRFLNAVKAVAHGECSAIEQATSDSWAHTPFRLTQTPSWLTERQVPSNAVEDLSDLAALTSISEEGEVHFSCLLEVDPTDSEAQHQLHSSSVYLQSMELSHYLPWSWDGVLPSETQALEVWVQDQLRSSDPLECIGGALVWLAMRLGRSLALVERLAIGGDVAGEWGMSSDFQHVARIAPRRAGGWRPSEIQLRQVADFGEELIVSLPKEVSLALRAADNVGDPSCLGELWRQVSTQKLEAWFNERAREHFARLTSGKLRNFQSQRIFDATGQPVFTRLLSSFPQGALPGACSYATWDVKAIEKGLQLPVSGDATASNHIHIMGSLLAPLESILAEEVERCNKILEEAARKGLVQYHNALAQYVVMALYAATGSRPLRDPFESRRHFSIPHRSVFINDKTDGGLHNGRLVPLPDNVLVLVEHYLDTLAELGRQVTTLAEELGEQIALLMDGRTAGLPLFFLLDDNLRWRSMTDAEQLNCQLFEWGLPANLFRHRYAQRLLHEGVDPEVIEGWMGHAERGVATYGDNSVRCWDEDVRTYEAALARAYDALPFTVGVHEHKPALLVLPENGSTVYNEPRLFGQQARAKRRRQRVRSAIRDARAGIELFLKERKLEQLSDEDLVRLCNRMLLRENRLPHPQAALRFRTLLKLLQRQAVNSTKQHNEEDDRAPIGNTRRRLLNQRLIELQEERSLISPDIIIALEVAGQLSAWAEQVRKTVLKGKLSKPHALCVGTCLLAVERRLGYERMLRDISAGRNYRIIQNKSRYFVEYSEVLELDDFAAAVQRHEISYKTASMLTHGLHLAKKTMEVRPAGVRSLLPLLQIYKKHSGDDSVDPELEQLVVWICRMINQANLVRLPGIVAAALSDRAPPTSAPLRDQIRLLEGRALELPSTAVPELTIKSGPVVRGREQVTDKQQLQQLAREFAREVTAALQHYTKLQVRECEQELKKLIDGYSGKVSSSMLLAGYWIAYRTASGKGKKARKLDPYAINSLTTYWSSISTVFRGLLYDVDLISLDSEDVTELCAKMLDYRAQTAARSSEYFGKRLQDFFRWAAPYGVAAPYWAELNIEGGHRAVNPGLIGESEYQQCLQIILTDEGAPDDQKLMLAFVLLLAYRFGLRAQEAIGLLRRDWCQTDSHTWVLVQNSRYRQLKSQASRRAVPLLFSFSKIEHTVVERILARYTSIAGNETNRPLLCEINNDDSDSLILTSIAPRISAALIEVIRQATGNPRLVLHHCRHAFYNRVAAALYSVDSPLASALCDSSLHSTLRSTVLGPVNGISRRSSMAMARLMGHRYPGTGLHSYCHLLTDWADRLMPVPRQRAKKFQGPLQLDELSTVAVRPQPELLTALSYQEPTLTRLFQIVRLAALGMGYERAGELLGVDPRHVELLQRTLDQVNSRMRFTWNVEKKRKIKGADHPDILIKNITKAAWQRMMRRSDDINIKGLLSGIRVDNEFVHELPTLVGINGHVLMESNVHCKFVKLCIDQFLVSPSNYLAAVKDPASEVRGRLSSAGFDPVGEKDSDVKLDPFKIYIPGRNSEYRVEDYGGVILSRSNQGVLRSSLDLVVALMVLGVAMVSVG